MTPGITPAPSAERPAGTLRNLMAPSAGLLQHPPMKAQIMIRPPKTEPFRVRVFRGMNLPPTLDQSGRGCRAGVNRYPLLDRRMVEFSGLCHAGGWMRRRVS